MRSLVGLFSNGGGFATFWRGVPFLVKAPLGLALVVLAGTELTRDVNIGVRSGRVAEGQAVDADSKIADPSATRAAVLAGKPVSGAERQIAFTVFGGEAEMREKEAKSDAALEAEEDLLAKVAKHIKLTSTEKLRLRELQLKEKELALREQELRIKTAEASAADNKAAFQNMIYGSVLGDDSGLDTVIEQGKRQAACATPQLGGCVDGNGLNGFGRLATRAARSSGVAGFTQRRFDNGMAELAGQPKTRARRDPGETVRKLEGRISDPFQ